MDDHATLTTKMRRILLLINCLILSVGVCGGPLIMRLYFVKGGSKIWLASWLQTGGWPLTLVPLAVLYLLRRRNEGGSNAKFYFITPRLFIASSAIGLVTGVCVFLYSYGGARLPVSTSSLLIAAQLAFTAVGAYFIVKMKFTAYAVNAVVLLTVGAAMLALRTNGDRPAGETSRKYTLGFITTVLAAALYGLVMPCIELTYMKAKQALTVTLVLEIQMVMCFASTVFCTVGMIANNEFQEMSSEGRQFHLGEARYYTVLVWTAIIWQCFYVGAIGVIYCSSSLMSGIVMSVLLPITEVLAVFFFSEKFQAEKGVALFLSLWGFISYFYGEYKQNKKQEQKEKLKNQITQETEMKTTDPIGSVV